MNKNHPNILLITSEDNGPHLSCYGDTNIHTPHLDELAASGVRFEHAQVTQAVCSPGRASILTGLYPHQNGQIGLSSHKFSMFGELPTIPGMLRSAGYRTGRIGKLHVLPESAFPFDWVWNTQEGGGYFQFRDMTATAEAAGSFMNKKDSPFFLMVNYADAHLPWITQTDGLPKNPLTAEDVQVPPAVGIDSPRLRSHAANYYNCLSRLDTGIGMLLDKLEKTGKADNTMVIYITDHGPQFSRGKGCCYELALRTPLILHWPKAQVQGIVCEELVSQVDIMPTVLDAAGITAPQRLTGKSLCNFITDTTPTANWPKYAFAEWNTSHPYPGSGMLFPQRCIRDRRYKLILNLLQDQLNPVENYYTTERMVDTGATQDEINAAPKQVQKAYALWRCPTEIELYDLESDPHEFCNLADDINHKDIRSRLLAELKKWRKRTNDAFLDSSKLKRFVQEHNSATALKGGHKNEDFCWEYVDYLKPDNT